jgi:hypothetical protein
MSEPTPPSETTPPAAPPTRRMPVWGWVVITVLGIALVALAVTFAMRGATPSPAPAESASETATEAAPAPSDTPTPTPPPAADALDPALTENFLAALNSGNTAIFAQGGYFSDPILVVAAASGLNELMSPEDAVSALDPLLSLEIAEPWSEASAADIEVYRSGAYAEYFPDGAIIVKSTQNHVISFIGSDHTVTTLFFAMVTDSLLP